MITIKSVAGLVFIGVPLMVPAAQSVSPQNEQTVNISVCCSRPVRDALDKLEAMYGWQMTFEDPPYENDDDLVDINNSPSAGRGVVKNLAPNGGQLNFEFPVPAVGPPDKQRTLEALMRAYGSQRPLNQFTVRHVGNVSHIVPVLLRRRDGQIAAAESILDQKISFPRAERNSWETFQLVLSSLSEATRTKINMGVVGMSVLRQATSPRARRTSRHERC